MLQWEHTVQVDGLVQERRNCNVLAMELRLSCTKPSKYWYVATMHNNEMIN